MSRIKAFLAGYFADMRGGWGCAPLFLFTTGAILSLGIFALEPITVLVCLSFAALAFWGARKAALKRKEGGLARATKRNSTTLRHTLIGVSYGGSEIYAVKWPMEHLPAPGDWILVPGPRGGRKRVQVVSTDIEKPRGLPMSKIKTAHGWARTQ